MPTHTCAIWSNGRGKYWLTSTHRASGVIEAAARITKEQVKAFRACGIRYYSDRGMADFS